jgi:hypothetical protein
VISAVTVHTTATIKQLSYRSVSVAANTTASSTTSAISGVKYLQNGLKTGNENKQKLQLQ